MTRCVVCQAERNAAVGLLCESHYNRAHQWLIDIETETAILSAVKPMQAGDGSHDTAPAFTRSPARLDVLVLRDHRRGTGRSEDDDDALAAGDTMSILDVLHSWARIVREERELAQPDQVTVVGERALLSAHLEWVAQQPWVDEFVAELRTLVMQLRAANGTGPIRKRAVGICPTLYEEGECGGRLWPDEARSQVTCEACQRVFTPEELRHLGEILIRQGYVEVFRAEWFTGVPAGTIRRWVAEGRCTSAKDGRKLMVQITEIEQLRDRRRVAS